MVSGLLGAGFTGSYIFSQTIFSMRASVQSKLHGFIIAGEAMNANSHRRFSICFMLHFRALLVYHLMSLT